MGVGGWGNCSAGNLRVPSDSPRKEMGPHIETEKTSDPGGIQIHGLRITYRSPLLHQLSYKDNRVVSKLLWWDIFKICFPVFPMTSLHSKWQYPQGFFLRQWHNLMSALRMSAEKHSIHYTSCSPNLLNYVIQNLFYINSQFMLLLTENQQSQRYDGSRRQPVQETPQVQGLHAGSH